MGKIREPEGEGIETRDGCERVEVSPHGDNNINVYYYYSADLQSLQFTMNKTFQNFRCYE